MNAPLLAVRDLVTTVRLGQTDVPAVNQISFDISAGRALGLVGESGSGKSLTALSLMRILAEPRVRIAGGRIDFEGRGSDARVQVKFRNEGTKWLALAYANLSVV